MDQTQSKKTDIEKIPVMTNEPLFKLNEPVTTSLNINSMTTINSANDEASLSFVVLGKDSMENVQASLLASYVDIQQKSMSIDYKTMISSLNIDEMQQRLTELLQENVKLKETLKQNNISMKQQFHILATWQEEVMKVHQNHKQKFAETREFISQLKKENADLKTKLLQWEQIENMGFEPISAIPESIASVPEQIEFQQSMLKLPDIASKMDIETCIEQYMTSKKFTEKDLHKSLDQLKVEKELESAMKSLSCNSCETSDKAANHQDCTECIAKHQEITCLKESIALLEQRLQCTLSPVPHYLSESSSSNRQKFIQSTKLYNDILHELTACFVGQIERFPVIEKNLKEITEILMLLEDDTSKIQFHQYREKICHFCKQLADEQVKIITDRQTLIKSQNQFQKILTDYNSILYELEITIDENAKLNVLKDNTTRESLQKSEELERIKQDRELFEAEKKIFGQEKDHLEREKKSLEREKKSLESQKRSLDIERNSLYDEKKLLDENAKLNVLKDNTTRESLQKSEELERIKQDREWFEYEKNMFGQERYHFEKEKKSLEREKKSLESQKRSLDIERDSLYDEKKLLAQEKISLNEEKMSLDQQSQLYEDCEKALQNEKKTLQHQFEKLLNETNGLRQELEKRNAEFKDLMEHLAQSTEEISLLRSQLTLYEEDFQHEKKLKEALLEEKSKLDLELQKQVEYNKQLQESADIYKHTSSNVTSEPQNDDSTAHYPSQCPKCELRFHSLSALMAHIDGCLEF